MRAEVLNPATPPPSLGSTPQPDRVLCVYSVDLIHFVLQLPTAPYTIGWPVDH